MSEKLIKPYEISVWEDKLIRSGSEYNLIENKLAIIGSDTMTGLNKVYDPVFTKKNNGEKTLTFSLKYKYFDPYTENEEVINPFAALLINERKVKLHYDDNWYEFIIKEHSESSEDYTWTYTCSDAFVLELSKTGYNIEFDNELNNNLGTAKELAEKTLADTNWTVEDGDCLRQLVDEPIYKATLVSTNDITIIDTDSGSEVSFSPETNIYLFYNYVANKDGNFVQFIIRNNGSYTIDDKNVITATNYRITTPLTYGEGGFYLGKDSDNIIISWNNIDTLYQANRLVFKQKTTYDPVTKRTVDCFKIGDDREVYKYTDYVYTTSDVVTNFIINSENFNILEKGTLQGWNPYVESTDDSSIEKLELVSFPKLEEGEKLADIDALSHIEGYLKVGFVGAITENYLNAIYNDGFQSNASFIGSVTQGDEFVFRWRAGSGELGNLQPVNTLGLVVAKYTRDAPQYHQRYYYHIDPNDVILDIRPGENNTPLELNNIIEGGEIKEIEGHWRYVIDDIVQDISTNYLYRDKTDHLLYYWDSVNNNFREKDSSFIPYYYLTGKALKPLSSSVLSNPNERYGIFIYTTENSSDPIYIQGVQLTRCRRDANNEPTILGNIPTATSTPIDYYYLKPSANAVEEEIQKYTSPQELQNAIGTTEEVVPIYNKNSEKNLSISVSKSNCFDILQTIAETFECWIDLVVDHDEKGYITYTDNKPNKKVYLREYAGKDNYAGFKYGINLKSIERQVNSDEIVTKLIVDLSQSEYVDEGYISIANASLNPSGESYILNFDYYYNQGLLDREIAEEDKNEFISKVKKLNSEIREKELERQNLEAALLKIDAKRTVFSETLDAAQDAKIEALNDFEYLKHDTYESYRLVYNAMVEAHSEDVDSLFDEENIMKILGRLYTSSATINNYSGVVINTDLEYWKLRKQLYGSEKYSVKIWSAQDDLGQTHVFIELDDYLAGLQFYVGSDDSNINESTITKKYFDIIVNPNNSEVGSLIVGQSIIGYEDGGSTQVTLRAPENYFFKLTGENIGTTYTYTTGSVITLQILTEGSIIGLVDEIDELLRQKKELVNSFNNKYSRFILEGTWNSTDYIDPELYYLDALQVSNTSAQPAVSYTINVVEVSELEGLQPYLFDAGDKTYIEDTEFFGWANVNVGTEDEPNFVLTPAREEVIVSEVEWHLDSPEENVITVQNYKTRFEDLFQRISATVQTVQYNEATYAKMSTLLDANGTINEDIFVDSMQRIAGAKRSLTTDGSISIDGDRITIQNLTETNKSVIMNSEGIRITSDSGQNWTTVINGQGINIGAVYTGRLNTDEVVIGSNTNPSFRWDKSGISAYSSLQNISDDTQEKGYDLKTFVRYDQYGLYGIKNNETFLAQSIEDIKDSAHFAVTWDGFFIKNSYPGGGRVEITSDNDFRVMNIPNGKTEEQEKIKIGALEWGKGITSPDAPGATDAPTLYGIRIKNNAGDTVMKTGDDGDLTITGIINATGGNFSDLITVGKNTENAPYIAIDGTNASIKSSNYSEGTGYGWMINKDGDAVFNNITARGAIKTAVFEYAEIQAVGGIFIFRPSSTIKTVEIVGNNLKVTVEKPALFKAGQWCKVSNYTNSGEATDPDVLLNNGLTHVYQVFRTQNSNDIILLGAAAMVEGQNAITTCEKIVGGALVDMGNKANGDGKVGTSNYGIGINSSDNTVNLPARAISLFETVVDETQGIKVSYNYRGILGTLPTLPSTSVNTQIYNNMIGTQGIYTDNMYLGDLEQYLVFYTDKETNKRKLKIRASELSFEIPDEHGQGSGHYQDVSDIEAEGVPGPAGQDAIQVVIDSSAGDIFKNREISSVLTCTVYAGTRDITNQVTSFTWQKKNSDGTIDTSWSRLAAGRSITIGPNDINSKAIFICTVEF